MNTRSFFNSSVRLLVVLSALLAAGVAQVSQAKIPQVGIEAPSYDEQAEWFVEIVDNSEDVGAYNSIAFDQMTGWPRIAYHNSTQQALSRARYDFSYWAECRPGSRWHCSYSQWDEGEYTSIDTFYEEDGAGYYFKVGISYYQESDHSLRYRYEEMFDGSGGGGVEEVEAPTSMNGVIGQYSSLKFDANGVPHIAYYAHDNVSGLSMLKYAHQVGVGNGNCGQYNNWQCDAIEESLTTTVGQYASLDIGPSQRPHIAYFGGALRYAWLSHPDGSPSANCGPYKNSQHTWTCEYVDSPFMILVGQFASLYAGTRGTRNPSQIAYYNSTHGYLKYAYQVVSGGNCGPSDNWQCDFIDTMGTGLTQKSIAMAVDALGKPVIAYKDAYSAGPASLNIAYPLSTTGNCGPGMLGTWQCSEIDGGGQYLDVADFVSIAASPSGLVAIAYNEYDEYNLKSKLKIAYQRRLIYLPLAKR